MSQEAPRNKIILMIRKRGSGKTPTIVGAPEHNVPSVAQIYIKKGMRVLVIDSEDHPAYRPHVTNIKPGTDMNALPPGFYRIFGTNFEAMFYEINKLWNYLLVYEDPKKYFGDRLDDKTRSVVLATKNRNCDSIFMFQSWLYATKELFGIADGLDIGKTGDSPEARKKELSGSYDKIFDVWTKIMASPDDHIHKYVSIN
jgi:hypothetical protein